MSKELSNTDAEALLQQFKRWMLGLVLLLLLPAIVYGVYVNGRLDTVLKSSSLAELEGEDGARSDLHALDQSPVEGQTVYVPAYSHVYHGAGEPYLLTVTLSIRNTSLESEIIVSSVRYFDTKGREVKSYLEKPVRLPALGTTEVVVSQDDTSGGSGANFLVEWHAKRPVTEPIIEAVMIATSSQQGISFARRGSVIKVAVAKGQAKKAGE